MDSNILLLLHNIWPRLSSIVKNLKIGHVYAPAIPQTGLAVFSNRMRKRLEPIVACETAMIYLSLVSALIKLGQQSFSL